MNRQPDDQRLDDRHAEVSGCDELTDADWEAYRYVIGDLSPAERAAWEERLEDDLRLCETVAEMTGLVETVHAAMHSAGPARPRNHAQRASFASPASSVRWLSASAAVLLLLGAVSFLLPWPTLRTASRTDTVGPQTSDRSTAPALGPIWLDSGELWNGTLPLDSLADDTGVGDAVVDDAGEPTGIAMGDRDMGEGDWSDETEWIVHASVAMSRQRMSPERSEGSP